MESFSQTRPAWNPKTILTPVIHYMPGTMSARARRFRLVVEGQNFPTTRRSAATSYSIRSAAVAQRILAAERGGRRGFGIELDPLYVDLAISRWHRNWLYGGVKIQTARSAVSGEGVGARVVPDVRAVAAEPAELHIVLASGAALAEHEDKFVS